MVKTILAKNFNLQISTKKVAKYVTKDISKVLKISQKCRRLHVPSKKRSLPCRSQCRYRARSSWNHFSIKNKHIFYNKQDLEVDLLLAVISVSTGAEELAQEAFWCKCVKLACSKSAWNFSFCPCISVWICRQFDSGWILLKPRVHGSRQQPIQFGSRSSSIKYNHNLLPSSHR